MRPILLKGHERPLTQIRFNKEGDIVITVAKDNTASVWYSTNGERLGTLEGHGGVIWSVDISEDTELAVTGSGDLSTKLWDIKTGECLYTWVSKSSVRRVEFNTLADEFLLVTDAIMGNIGSILVMPLNKTDLRNQSEEPILQIDNREGVPKVMMATYSYNSKYIITGHNGGWISKFDAKSGDLIDSIKIHDANITDLQMSPDKTYFITASKDKSAKLIDVDTFKVLKVYESDSLVNTAAITPVKEFIILGGGQDASQVTTTSSDEGKFEAKFYHKVFADEIGRVPGHFGPLNYIAIHPKGTGYISGGEDGFVRLHNFDKPYFDFQYDVEVTANSTIA